MHRKGRFWPAIFDFRMTRFYTILFCTPCSYVLQFISFNSVRVYTLLPYAKFDKASDIARARVYACV